MRWSVVPCFAAGFLAYAFAYEPVKTVQSGRPFAGESPLPHVNRGYVFWIDHSAVMSVYGPSGQSLYTVEVKGPNGPAFDIHDAAADDSGSVAATISFEDRDTGYQGGVAILDSTGNQVKLIRTGRYAPVHLGFGRDGSIWTIGWQRDAADSGMDDTQDYKVIRRFNRQGEQTGAFVDRSSFPRPGLSPGGYCCGLWGIRASGDKIGAWMTSGETSERMVWLELDGSGKELGRWTLPPQNEHNGTAFAGGELYSIQQPAQGEYVLSRFERKTSTWKSLRSDGFDAILMDADGDELILAKDRGAVYEWVKP
jgi:hypothetical protein